MTLLSLPVPCLLSLQQLSTKTVGYRGLTSGFGPGRQSLPGSFAHSNLNFSKGVPPYTFAYSTLRIRFSFFPNIPPLPFEPHVFAGSGSIQPRFGDRETAPPNAADAEPPPLLRAQIFTDLGTRNWAFKCHNVHVLFRPNPGAIIPDLTIGGTGLLSYSDRPSA